MKPGELLGEPKNCARCTRDFMDFSEYRNRRVCSDCRVTKRVFKPISSRGLAGKPLSPREQQIVSLVIAGKLNKEIAYILHLTEGTVKVFMSAIFCKAAVSNRTALAVWAMRENIQRHLDCL